MGQFLGGYSLRETDTRMLWRYVPDNPEPLRFRSDNGKTYWLWREMDTDGASSPRVFWWIPGLSPWDWPRAAILHDWLWNQRYSGTLDTSFMQSNKLLREALRSLGWSRWFAWLIFWIVTLFGWYWWISGEKGTNE